MLSKLMNSYNRLLLSRPLLGNALTSATGMALGNFLCQFIMLPKNGSINYYQIGQYASFGFFISGPFLKFWWYALELKIFKNKSSFLRPVKMMLLDQSTSPYILNGAFLLYLNQTEGRSLQEGIESIKQKLMKVVIESYKIWPLATMVNFYLIPLHNRVLFSNVIAILWVIYLTYLVN